MHLWKFNLRDRGWVLKSGKERKGMHEGDVTLPGRTRTRARVGLGRGLGLGLG